MKKNKTGYFAFFSVTFLALSFFVLDYANGEIESTDEKSVQTKETEKLEPEATTQPKVIKDDALQQHFEYYYNTPSDLNEHIPVLRDLASQCCSVTEVGAKSLVATWGILKGLSESPCGKRHYLGIDSISPPRERLDYAKDIAEKENIDFKFWAVDEMVIVPEPCDMLFIDSLHTYCHLSHELEAFSPKVRKFICMHDTSEPWGSKDDSVYRGDYAEYSKSFDRTKRGLWPAVEDFLQRHPEWCLLERRTNNHGFTILKRNPESPIKEYTYHPDVEYTLKNKMVLCTGPSLDRYQRLKDVTESDLRIVPFKKIFVTTNDPKNMSIKFLDKKPVTRLNSYTQHQLGCINCLIGSLKDAANDPELDDDDIVMFKHESCFINDMHLVKQAVGKILEGYDMVARAWQYPYNPRGTDGFFVKVSALREVMPTITYINEFPPFAPYCECYFGQNIAEKTKVYDIPYTHLNWENTELGFWHVPNGFIPGAQFWDKSNYDQLYN